MKYFTLIVCLITISGKASAQNMLNADYRAMGLGGGYMFNIDDAALNTNPSLLGWQSKRYNHTFAFNFKDFYLSSFSPLISTSLSDISLADIGTDSDDPTAFESARSLWVAFEMMESYDPNSGEYTTYDTTISREARANYKAALLRNNNVKVRNTLIGFTYNAGEYGTFSMNINKETSARFSVSETFADFWAYGKTASYFDTLVLIDGSHYANEEVNYQDSILSQAYIAFSNDTMTIHDIMKGSHLEYVRTRNYSVGWGNEIPVSDDKWEVYVGANLNIIEGIEYSAFSVNDEGISIARFSKDPLEKTPFMNAGFGASVSFSGTAIWKDKWMISTGFNNVGAIRWKVRGEGNGIYSDESQNDEYENYAYGVAPNITFDDQLTEANFNWLSIHYGDAEDRVTKATPANYHLGIRREVGKVFSFGLDMVRPLNVSAPGSMNQTVFAFSYEFEWKKFSFYSGFNNMNQRTAMPLGITFGGRASKWEVGLSISDLLGYLSLDKTNNFSAGAGIKYRIK